MKRNLTRAISEWKQILPDYRILLEYKDLQRYSLSTLGDQYKVSCSLLPISTKELSRIVIIANKYKIKIFPLSKGNNHGYNSATAMADNFVIIDLQNLNQILEYNQEFGYVVIEPGTSFIDLYKYLALRNSDYMMSSFSGNPNSSIIGNALERGTGKGPYGNRELCSVVKEIVLADGRIIELRSNYQVRDLTDFARYSTTGIDISSLFYQSNLAIITKMIVYLEPIPNHLLIVSVNLNNDEGMLQLFSRLRQLNRLGITKPCYSVYNDIRAIVGSGLYKRPKTNITQNLESIIRDFYSKVGNKINKWNSSFAVHCYCKEDLQIKQKTITKHLQGITNCLSFHKIKKSDAKLLINESFESIV
jgi:4-cresol dehydrogenase (hydroxylating)